MNSDQKRNFPDTLAKTVSVIFHPLFTPLYGLTIIFTTPTLFGYLPFPVKKLLFLIVLINNVLLPISLMPLFMRKNLLSSWTIDNRQERIIPMVLTTILYLATSFIIFKFPVPGLLKSYIFAASFLSLIVTVINFWWKISLHSVGAGALIAFILILSLKMHTNLIWYLNSAIVAGGLVLSSRLHLNFHNPGQVWLGFFTGFVGLIFFMLFFH